METNHRNILVWLYSGETDSGIADETPSQCSVLPRSLATKNQKGRSRAALLIELIPSHCRVSVGQMLPLQSSSRRLYSETRVGASRKHCAKVDTTIRTGVPTDRSSSVG